MGVQFKYKVMKGLLAVIAVLAIIIFMTGCSIPKFVFPYSAPVTEEGVYRTETTYTYPLTDPVPFVIVPLDIQP